MKRAPIAGLILLLAACQPPEEQPTESIGRENFRAAEARSAPVREQLDSGNAAIRARQFEQARRHFTTATTKDPKSKPAWFGLYLAERALGNADAANAALARAQKLAPGATLMRADSADTTR
jgi:Tfp pilus assembly protein PilF